MFAPSDKLTGDLVPITAATATTDALSTPSGPFATKPVNVLVDLRTWDGTVRL